LSLLELVTLLHREWSGEENFIPKIVLRKYVYKPPREQQKERETNSEQ